MQDFQKRLFISSLFVLLIFFIFPSFDSQSVDAANATVTINTPVNNSFIGGSGATGGGAEANYTISLTITNATNISDIRIKARNSAGTLIPVDTNITVNNQTNSYTTRWKTANGSYTDGVYTLIIDITSVNGTANPSPNEYMNVSVGSVTVDNTAPIITFDLQDARGNSKTKFPSRSKIKIICSRKDATAGYNATEVQLQIPGFTKFDSLFKDRTGGTALADVSSDLTEIDTLLLGDYFVKCIAFDRSGNNVTIQSNFTVIVGPPISSSAFANPKFKRLVSHIIIGKGSVIDVGVLTTEGLSRLMALNAAAVMNINGEDHKFEITEVKDLSVVIQVMSEPFSVEIQEEESKQVDVNGDGVNDVEITLHQVYHKKGDITFTLISTPAPPKEERQPPQVQEIQPPAPQETPKTKQIITFGFFIIILVVIVLLILHFLGRRGASKEEGIVNEGGVGTVKFTPRDLGMYKDSNDEAHYENPPTRW